MTRTTTHTTTNTATNTSTKGTSKTATNATTIFTSESVTEGHPDKICDQISDAILDEALRQDPLSRVAIECLIKDKLLVIAGEITTTAHIDYTQIARDVISEIGYGDPSLGFDLVHCKIIVDVSQQSPDIARGVDGVETGAGDQGMMFGYATDETPDLMPLPISLAHALSRRLAQCRHDGILNYLRPDGKTQVSIEYDTDSKPVRAHTIVVSCQHNPSIPLEQIRQDVIDHIIVPVCRTWLDAGTIIHVNPTGRFVIGGPAADSGLTGRKIIVDTYGGAGRHGGGAFSGKDPTKVDRSGAYAARHIAKNIVAAGLASRCEVQLAYAIGVAQPVSIHVDTHGTGTIPSDRITELIRHTFDLRPGAIIANLNLRRPIYRRIAAYGHIGRAGVPWEDTSISARLAHDAGIFIPVILAEING